VIVFVSDMFADEYPGGAELTTEALIEKSYLPIKKIKSKQLNLKFINESKDCFWVFGNFSQISDELLIYISQNLNYSVLEYDYKFCSYRSTEKHELAENICDCKLSKHGKSVSIFMSSASTIWFMSEGQKKFYCDMYPFLNKESTRVLSSVFDINTLKYFSKVNISNKNNTWLIQGSDSWIKGTTDAISYAKKECLEYEVFYNLTYEKMLNKFANYKGFISFPKGKDTCPRTAIEAKLLGCEIICNSNVQHKDEEWFCADKSKTLDYLKQRTKIFWDITLDASNLNVPTLKDLKYKNKIHFKIVVPVYNAESWISSCLQSILDQEYDNYECIICDDISSDNTFSIANNLTSQSDNIKVIRNSNKKFALKNISDAIDHLNPSPEDVIIILDGDDWFSTNHVLSNISSHYQKEKCYMTYGSFIEHPSGRIGTEASNYSIDVIESNTYRQDKWRASHLKTFKFFLWNKIEKTDLMDDDGKFYEMTYDQAIMLPMLEMSGYKSKYIDQINYVYNTSNPNAVNKTRAQKQHNLMLKIRSKQKYERLKDENIS
jgi:hypothetical protein